MTKRAMLRGHRRAADRRVQFEADVLAYAQWERLARGRGRARAVERDRRGAPRGQGRRGGREDPRAARIADRGFEALTAETLVGRSEREIAWRLRELLHAHGADELSFDTIVASGPNGALPHAHPTDRIVDRGDARHGRLGRARRRLLQRLHAHVLDRPAARPLREAYDVCLAAQERAVAGIKAGMTGVDADALAREPIDRRRLRRELRPRPRARRRVDGARGAAALDRVDGHARARPRRHDRAGIYLEGSAACGSRTSRVVRDDGIERADLVPEAPDRGRASGRSATPAARRWPRSSPPTSSATGCTSSSRARRGGSSSSSTSSRARAARSCARS